MPNDDLDASQILQTLAPSHRHYVANIEVVSSVASTNSYLLTAVKTLPPGTILLAEEQTAGRGRQGKAWFSPKGINLYCSLVWHIHSSLLLSPLALTVAVLLASGLERFGLSNGLQLKWPNDIYYTQRKLAGILIESTQLQDDHYAVVIGFGMNVNRGPIDALQYPAICLQAILNKKIDRNALIGTLLSTLLPGLHDYEQQGFAPFIKAWQQYDMLQGKYVIVHTAQGPRPGIALGINLNGELVVRNEYGKESAYHSGEVSVMLGLF